MSERLRYEFLVAGALCAGIGLIAGVQLAPADVQDDTEDDLPHARELPEGHFEHLPAETLEALGVTVGDVGLEDAARTVPVAAHLAATPTTLRTVAAPLAGRVRSVVTELGAEVEPGATLVELLRAPLPRPDLRLTANVLEPGQEGLHDTIVELRRAVDELALERIELERLETLAEETTASGLPLVPQQLTIEQRYAVRRAEQAYDRTVHELLAHGLSDEQVRAIEAGAPIPVADNAKWQRALRVTGLWPAIAERLHETLPEEVRVLPWTTATIAELAGRGLASEELAAWLAEDRRAAARFLDLGVLLQQGHSLAELRELVALGALEERTVLAAPALAGASWQVAGVHAQPGQVVEIGAPLLTLRDPRRLHLVLEPVGGELASLELAASRDLLFRARPLPAGVGPVLEDLRVDFLLPDAAAGRTRGFARVENVRAGAAWTLREGTTYVAEVPLETLEDVIVLPTEAVTERGPLSVVFRIRDDRFERVPVRVLHRSSDRVVIAPAEPPGLAAGDRIVLTGAFRLGLALEAQHQDAAAHHGHAH